MAIWPLPRIVFRELSSVEENRPVALLTQEDVWAVLSPQLSLPILIQAEPTGHNRELLDYLAENLPAQVKAIYAVGTGAPIMAGKYIAARRNVPLVIVPTALDSDALLTPFARVDEVEGDQVHVVLEETGPATEVIIDWGIIQSAPADQRAGGIVDVLSVVTGLLDWRYAAQHGKNPRDQRFEPWAASISAGLAKEVIKGAAAFGQGEQTALQTLLNLMMTAVQLSNQLQHTRAQQGAEHYLAQMLTAHVGDEVSQAALVGPCLLLVSALHGQAPAALKSALEQAGVPLDQLRGTDAQLVLNNLPAYLAAYDFPYSILNDLDPASDTVAEALEAAGLAIKPETWELSDSQRMLAVSAEEAAPEAASVPAVEPVVSEVAPAEPAVSDAAPIEPAVPDATPAESASFVETPAADDVAPSSDESFNG